MEQETHLQALQTDLGTDPARAARQLQAIQRRLNAAVERLRSLMAAITDENTAALRTAAQRLATAQAVSRAASADLFAAEPLPDIGSDIWKALWETAHAYPKK